MTYISEADKDKVLAASQHKLIEIIENFTTLHKSGVSYLGKCPMCGQERGLTVTPGKGIFKCFRCNGINGKYPIDYLMKGQNYSFPDALQYLATHCGIILEEPEQKPKVEVKKAKKNSKEAVNSDTYCARMLAESGLSFEDVITKIYKSDDKKSIFECKTFKPGTVDEKGNIVPGDDVIIEYYDLEGFPIKYEVKKKNVGTGIYREYFRIRWQYPDEHKDQYGRPQKYKSPYGSHTYIYIPAAVRELFKNKTKIPRLYIQEGEKKAEKACKHGLPSVAISGIQNLGTNGRLPEDLIKIIAACEVEEVAFLIDADWDDLSPNLKVNDQVEQRPRFFFSAVKNYKEYMRALKNRDIYIEIYFGHVKPNEAHDKGVDDLLSNTLKGKETLLAEDIDYLINEKDLNGKYIQLHKITTWTDHKLEELWCLNNPKMFAERHRASLKDFPEFKIGRHRWKFENGELVSAQPIESDEQFWEEKEKSDRSGNISKVTEFKYVRSHRFLQNRGFGRYRRLDGTFEFVHLTPPTIRTVQHWEIRDFLFEFAQTNCNEEVNEMLIRGGIQYLGPDKLGSISFIEPAFVQAQRDRHFFYFSNTCWEVTKDKIVRVDYASISHHIWGDKRKNFPAEMLKPLITFVTDDKGKHSYTLSEEGEKCHFLKFLINTSNFTWRKEKQMANKSEDVIITSEELQENVEHLLAKLCAIGYMLMDYKDANTAKAVVGMDGKQSEVGASNGRSGKSIIGVALTRVSPTVYINGKKSDISTDQFVWDEITEKTKTVFIDDVRPGFDFESQFANITGDWSVNYKGGRRCTYPFASSPKLYITTNHALNGEGSSFKDRQYLIAFSDFYNDEHKPVHDFGQLFFDEWDFEQWNPFWNLLAICVQLYLTYGVVESPGERLEQRILRQTMGENFIMWAEEYFSNEQKRNIRLNRRDLYDSFTDSFPNDRKWTTPTLFKKKIKKYCEWRNYIFNPQKYDVNTGLPMCYDADGKPDFDDKSGGVEYFTIGDDKFGTGIQQKMNLDPLGENVTLDELNTPIN